MREVVEMKFIFGALLLTNLFWAEALSAAESGWIKPRALKSVMSKMTKRGLYPISVNCRNSPKAKVTPRPEVNVRFGKVSGARDAVVYFHKGSRDYHPYNLLTKKTNGWRRGGKKRSFRAGSSRSIYSCYFWIQK